ncbi:DUF2804 domain-containing protein [Aquabacterium sp.]|uniref:DUF2804 domain-containing protein n=1 Tax=Aquabacterium sp. TaxID=1872578 RepID=UPI0025C0C779|nr:DUF2804 domain-containing protein [Aquabacterium sp.]
MWRDLPAGLPPAPDAVVHGGEALVGRYQGRVPRIDWSGLDEARQHSALWRWAHHKRWQYVGIATPELFIGVAVVDLGWCMTAFAYVFHRFRQRLIADWDQDGLPGLSGRVTDAPLEGMDTAFRGLGAAITLQHLAGDVLALRVRAANLTLRADLDLATAPPVMVAVGPIEGGAMHSTHKTSAMSVRGEVDVDGLRWDLADAHACLDSSNGLLARETAWRWASAHRPGLGFNLQQGYFGNMENTLWLDGELIPLGAADFQFDAQQPLAPWAIRTDDGLLDLRFEPQGARCADRDLGLAASRYIQPVGIFSGEVRRTRHGPSRPIGGLLGVTEDHRSVW